LYCALTDMADALLLAASMTVKRGEKGEMSRELT
jgi:hypothetical protein